MLPTHGTTHIDALAHVWRDGVMYNGFAATNVTSRGAARCGIDKVGAIVTRAILLDLARPNGAERTIHAEELAAAAERLQVRPEPGDALLIRTGWLQAFREGRATKHASAGLHRDCAGWIVDAGFAMVGADNIAVETMPSNDPGCAMPLHIALTRDSGVYLAELFDLELLAARQRPTFLLVVAPLRLRGGAGSPVTPVAVL